KKIFDEMLSKNLFVAFWGYPEKIGSKSVDGGVKVDIREENEGDGGDGKVDMKGLAKNVDVEEVEKVLKVRFLQFS
ncbi:hypothetical protein H0H92_010195, partial [Tricholoma furcatifolium]